MVAHYYGAIVFVASLAIHVIIKMPMVLRVYKDREWIKPIRAGPGRADDLPPRR